MAKQSKFFRVAVEGTTADGREIARKDLVDIAATYNRTTYGARANLEHIRGVTAEPPFCAYGDVLAVKTEEVELELGGKTVRKLALLAQIEPNAELEKINAKGQKIYSSIEIQPNFANSGKAYLVGLAVTDSPASLGTEALKFAITNPDALRFQPRLQAKENLFSTGIETAIEVEDAAAQAPAADASAGFFTAAAAFFQNLTKGQEKPADQPVIPPAPANDNTQFTAQFAAIASGIEAMSKGITAMSAEIGGKIDKLRADHDALATSIETTDGNPERRPPASGLKTYAATDC